MNLLNLISLIFPEPLSTKFFVKFNQVSIGEQKNVIESVNKGLYDQVDSQQGMILLANRLENAVAVSSAITNSDIRLYYDANLLLYEQSLYTHLGNQKKTEEISIKVHEIVDLIEDDNEKDNLLDIADNRHIVDLTDAFAYDDGVAQYEKIESYWKQKIDARKRRTSSTPRYPIFGKTIGSYLQLLGHMIHTAKNAEDKMLYYSLASDKYQDYLWHMGADAKELSRCHQVLSELESEVEHYGEAIQHLYQAALYSKGIKYNGEPLPSMAEIGQIILDVSGNDGAKSPYMMQHYCRLSALMYSNGKEAEDFIQPLLLSIVPQIGEKIHAPHPKTQIQWKAASLIANRKNSTV